MKHSPFFLALAVAASTAALGQFSVGTTLANDADNAAEASEQATSDAQAAASQGDTSANAGAEVAADTSSAADVGGSANVGTDQAHIQGSAQVQGSAQAPVNGQVQPLPSGGAAGQTDAQQGLNIGQQSNVTQGQAQIDARQSGQLQANSQLTAQALDQQLGVQFDQANRAAVQGLTIATLQPNSVLYSSGLRQGDVLLSIDNRPIADRAEFGRMLTTYQQNRIPLIVLRNGQRQTIYFNRPAEFVASQQPTAQSQAILGITFDSGKGGAAVIRAVTPNSPAEQAGIMTGDVITSLNGQPVLAAHEVVRMIGAMQPGQQVTLDVVRQQQKFRIDTVLAARSEPVRQSVGYAPDPAVVPIPNPAGQPVIRGDATYQVQPVRPGDPDGDGRLLDGDGRIPRRVLNDRR